MSIDPNIIKAGQITCVFLRFKLVKSCFKNTFNADPKICMEKIVKIRIIYQEQTIGKNDFLPWSSRE